MHLGKVNPSSHTATCATSFLMGVALYQLQNAWHLRTTTQGNSFLFKVVLYTSKPYHNHMTSCKPTCGPQKPVPTLKRNCHQAPYRRKQRHCMWCIARQAAQDLHQCCPKPQVLVTYHLYQKASASNHCRQGLFASHLYLLGCSLV